MASHGYTVARSADRETSQTMAERVVTGSHAALAEHFAQALLSPEDPERLGVCPGVCPGVPSRLGAKASRPPTTMAAGARNAPSTSTRSFVETAAAYRA